MPDIHLAVLIHGLHGNPGNLAQCEIELVKAHQEKRSQSKQGNGSDLDLQVFIPSTFPGTLTFDGVELLAIRVADELDKKIERIGSQGGDVKAITIMGYSLGGLIARYLITLLDSRTPSFFERHEPIHFSTIATPNLGMPRYGTKFSTIKHLVGGHMFSQTGAELFSWDHYSEQDPRSLLEVMSDPTRPFMQTLRKFPKVQIIANGCHDLTVSYPTAAITETDPFDSFETTGIRIKTDENSVVKSWSFPSPEAEGEGEDETDTLVKTRSGQKGLRKRPSRPPFLEFRFPFNYLAIPLIPIVATFFVISAFITLTIQRFRSSKRIRRYRSSRNNLAVRISQSVSDGVERAGDFLQEQVNGDWNGDDFPVRGKAAKLLLTEAQKTMIRNFNQYLPQLERIVVWYPYAYNSHATIVVRDVTRFPSHEDGRGGLKVWAKSIVDAV
ncbi:hypothetical protein FFLO_02346 [Filobasidium floriforme]|uniref:DUF676 domain-containing protein n=1 Tax=Filobasidium floriforme TaxID=5210 RepID=A0A8K0JMW0_9TREE|nr:putative lipid particle protein [Filobasidium floriforme]KAG7562260.1 hypothetical protein FFLO_02346 [Filobasidium floriforme]KAH8080566.1 putative lipid particle protein [Filobasidium floriforme]